MESKKKAKKAKKNKAVFFGELLLGLAAHRHERFVQAKELEVRYTGAEANAAVSASHFGLECFVVSAVPQNDIGSACVNFIRQYGINTEHVLRTGSRLGIFYLETGASQRPSKVIYDRSGSAITEVRKTEFDWKTIFHGKQWFHFSGTAPALGSNVAEAVADACEAARREGLTVSCDINFRRKLWSPERAKEVMTGLMENVDVLIGNEEDAANVFGIEASGVDVTSGTLDRDKYRQVAGKLHESFDLRVAAITLRESLSASDNNWSAMLYDGAEFHFSRRYRIRVVDRVGAGDSFSGALIYSLISGRPAQEALEFAVAASCLKHTVHGDFNLVTKDEVERLLAGDASGRVQR